MKTNFITIFVVFLLFSQFLAGQNFEKKFEACWGDTFWEFEFRNDESFTRISFGHYGNTEVEGKYKLKNDTLRIIEGFENTNSTINDVYVIQEDTILIDINLGYGYVQKSMNSSKIMKCEISYPEIFPTKEFEVIELEKVLNLALNSPEINKFYHFTSNPNRKLLISNYHKLKANILIDGKQALFKDKKDLTNNFFIEIDNIEMGRDNIKITIKIPLEGVIAKFYYYKINGEWKNYKPEITET